LVFKYVPGFERLHGSLSIAWSLASVFIELPLIVLFDFDIHPLGRGMMLLATAGAAIVATILDLLIPRPADVPRKMGWRHTLGYLVFPGALLATILTARMLDSQSLLPRNRPCPPREADLFLPRDACDQISELRAQWLDGSAFVQQSAARFTAEAALLDHWGEQYEAVSPSDVPDIYWRLFPIWWRPRQDDGTLVLRSSGFSLEHGSNDGVHHLIFIEPDSRTVHLFVRDSW
jgi:hypothetical protein